MKKALIFIFLIPIVGLFLHSCNDDEDSNPGNLWYSYATLIKDESANGYFFNLDSGGKLIPTNSLDLSEFEDTTRVYTKYYPESDEGEGQDRLIEGDIQLIREILTKDIIQLTEENVDSIGNNYIHTDENSIWKTEDHLNIIFYYYGYNQTHIVNLAKPIGTQVDTNGFQILELRHNSNNDYETYYYQSEVSFNMQSLKEADMDSINYVLKAIEGDTNNFTYYGTFHFNEVDVVSKSIPNAKYNENALMK